MWCEAGVSWEMLRLLEAEDRSANRWWSHSQNRRVAFFPAWEAPRRAPRLPRTAPILLLARSAGRLFTGCCGARAARSDWAILPTARSVLLRVLPAGSSKSGAGTFPGGSERKTQGKGS